MNTSSIDAYDLPDRVASYDADMEIMHPNRIKMVEIALEVLPFPPDSTITALDLGIGTGFFTGRFLDELETNEGDQPLSLMEDLQIIKKAGLKKISVFWLEYREVVYGGVK